MTFPSTNQMTGQTGIPVRHRYNDYYSMLSRQLPARVQAENQNRYYNDMLDVEQRNQQATERYYDNMYALNQDQAEAAEDARKKGLWIQGAGLGLAGANALNQYTDGGVEKAGRAALDMVMPKTPETLPGGFNLAGVDKAGAPPTDSFWDSASSGVGKAAVAVGDFAMDYIGTPLKKIGENAVDAFTDVTGFLGKLMP